MEDLVWSPSEAGVLMSCGCDSTVRVWDVRKKTGSAMTVDEVRGSPTPTPTPTLTPTPN